MNEWFAYFNLSQSETELQVVVKNSCVYNKHYYYNLYYAYIKVSEECYAEGNSQLYVKWRKRVLDSRWEPNQRNKTKSP